MPTQLTIDDVILQCVDCKKLIRRKPGAGRKPQRCPGCNKKRLAYIKKRWKQEHKDTGYRKPRPECCQDRICPQHKQAREAKRESARAAPRKTDIDNLFNVFSADDGYHIEQPLPKEHDAAAAWLAEHDPDWQGS